MTIGTSVKNACRIGVGGLAVLLLAIAGSGVSYQLYIVAVILLLAGMIWKVETTLLVAAASTVCVALIRRLLADEGRQDFDPLVVLPVALMIVALIYGRRPRRGPRDLWSRVIYAAIAVMSVALVVTGRTGVPFIFTFVVQSALLLVVVHVRSGRLPDVWGGIERFLPTAGVLAASYGIAQFFFLYEWDRLWMIASGLTTIGQPFPEELRVFGTAESPASFAAILSAALLVSLARIRMATNSIRRLLLIVGMFVITFGIVLTGVRSALLGLVAALVWMAISGRGGVSRIIPVALAVVGAYFVVAVVERFGAGSSILSADRLTGFDAASDESAQTRLALIKTVPESMLFPFGRGAVGSSTGVSNLDNMFVDLLWKAGPFVAIAVLALFLKVLYDVVVVRNDLSCSGAAGVAVFTFVFSLSLNPFSSANGLIGALAFGAVLRRAWLLKAAGRLDSAPEARRSPWNVDDPAARAIPEPKRLPVL